MKRNEEPAENPFVETGIISGNGRIRTTSVVKPPKDELLGKTVIFFIVVLLLSGTVFFVYLGYRILEGRADDRVSIGTLETEIVEEPVATFEPELVPSEVPAETTVAEKAAPFDKTTVAVSVLNAGAPGGTAGKVAETLRKAGFPKTEAGNADASYSVVTIFYGEGFEDAASAVREALVGTYVDAVVAPADTAKKDTTVASVTVMLTK